MWLITGTIITIAVLALALCRIASRTDWLEVYYGLRQNE
jgi:hypothetical protein